MHQKLVTIQLAEDGTCSVIPVNINIQEMYQTYVAFTAHIASQLTDPQDIYQIVALAAKDATNMINQQTVFNSDIRQ